MEIDKNNQDDKAVKGEEAAQNGPQNQNDQNYQFYQEYCRLYYANMILTNRLSTLLNEKHELQFKLNKLEVGGPYRS